MYERKMIVENNTCTWQNQYDTHILTLNQLLSAGIHVNEFIN